MTDPQRFEAGDLVRVAKDLGPSMAHFTADCDAIVIGSYADQFGGSNCSSYTLHIDGRGETSWYEEWQLTLIERGRFDIIQRWKVEAAAERKQKSDLDWIFAHGAEVIKATHGATVEALARTLGMDNLWGSRGEGMTYYANTMTVMGMALPFLVAGDKAGWLSFADRIKTEKRR